MNGRPLMTIHFRVVSAFAAISVHVTKEGRLTKQSNSFTLRAEPETMIVMETGDHISNFDVHVATSSAWKSPEDFDTELAEDELGHLNYSSSVNGIPHLNAALLWLPELDPQRFMHAGTAGRVQLGLSNLLWIADHEDPHVWNPNYESLLRIKSVSFSIHASGLENANARWVSP